MKRSVKRPAASIDDEISSAVEAQFARWNHNFTLISIIHGAFLGAFLSRIDFRESAWGALLVLASSLLLTASLYEIHGFGLSKIKNAVHRKFGSKQQLIFTLLFMPAAPATVVIASQPSPKSQFYATLAVVVVFSWAVAAALVSGLIASETAEEAAKR